MNYIRGAITAPYQAYQYYKDLPPINPATLTGAIDVIVIQRPTDSGDLELACSPFHVRFGKWQVLRPADKKVNVSVNGHRIPFDMKIGEAGEAFFVFETEQDVPEELITSPVLRATSPVSSPSMNAQDLEDLDANQKLDQREPEFLDLNTGDGTTDTSLFQLESHLPSPPVSPSPIAAEDEVAQNRRADEALKRYVRDIASQQLADVQYRSDVTLDAEGYRVQPKTKYITKADASPLMDALSIWRAAAINQDTTGTRPVSPTFEERLPLSPPSTSDDEDEDDSGAERRGRAMGRAPADDAADNVQLRKRFAKTLRLSSDQLKALNLKPGPNAITFSLATSGSIACTARIFVWDSSDLVLVSDIDGTITKSDGLGHVFAMIGRDWTHSGVAKLYTDICRNGYKIMYLTSRAIGQADATRDYLKGINQNNYQLPEGPVIMSPDRLLASLHREVIMRKPEVFKMACLRDIQRLFGEGRNPFYAGFGNRITDGLSYRSVNIPSARIFTIDSTGEVKLELLELAGYKSSYIHMTDLVDQMFPPINRKWAPEYTDFKYWRPPM
ncbi:LNS2-domain-containing protein, partial [Fistulina hepatica ATCC 64428]